MRKSIFVNSIYGYYQNHSIPGIKVTKTDLKKFPSKILARGHFAIVNHNNCPRVLSLLISQKQEMIGKKPLIDYLLSYYAEHPTSGIRITELDLIRKTILQLNDAVNLAKLGKFPWLLIELINLKRKNLKRSQLFLCI